MEPPVIYWVPAIAVSGLTFYTGDRYPGWKNNLFIGGMREAKSRAPATSKRIDSNDQWEELHREGILRDLHNRIRDILQGPDGLLYLLTAEADGALLRIDPAKPSHDGRSAGQWQHRAPLEPAPATKLRRYDSKTVKTFLAGTTCGALSVMHLNPRFWKRVRQIAGPATGCTGRSGCSN
jgi:hypothetical protein